MTHGSRLALAAPLLLLGALAGCPESPVGTSPVTPPQPVAHGSTFDQIPRLEVNRLAAELGMPLFWDRDVDADGALDPEELAVLWTGIEPTERASWVRDGKFTEGFVLGYGQLLARKRSGPNVAGLPSEEANRQSLLRRELEQGRPAVLRTNFAGASPADRELVAHLVAASRVIERLYLEQVGSYAFHEKIPVGDGASRAVFHRNHGPWCVAPETEASPACSALPTKPRKLSGLYPEKLQAEPTFCDKLKALPNATELRSPFTVVQEKDGQLVAVPYHVAYAEPMASVARELREAGALLGPEEAALKEYLAAAAKAFGDGSWEQADEAWAHMSATNSKWYLRIAPDEVYFEPCSLKAGFHMSFARINPKSVEWQKLLDPYKAGMEAAIAVAAGSPYAPRPVSFNVPDFIDVVLNAGNSREAHGATIGQSLPNWGPVANEGRGRTVAMTNIGNDPDGLEVLDALARSTLCNATMPTFTTAPEPHLIDTVLHEVTHNLGPAHEYRVGGKTDREIFGGPLASMLEELKAQTGALFFTDWLAHKRVLDPQLAARMHVRSVTWAFGHVSRGMTEADGKPRPYSQLSAILLGWLMQHGAIVWRAAETAANGKDVGCMDVRTDAFPGVIGALMSKVAGIKSRGDLGGAERLVADYVAATGEAKAIRATIQERWLRAPKVSYVYALEP